MSLKSQGHYWKRRTNLIAILSPTSNKNRKKSSCSDLKIKSLIKATKTSNKSIGNSKDSFNKHKKMSKDY